MTRFLNTWFILCFQSFPELAYKPLLVDLTVEEGLRLKVIYGSNQGFHAIDLDTSQNFDLYIPSHVSPNTLLCLSHGQVFVLTTPRFSDCTFFSILFTTLILYFCLVNVGHLVIRCLMNCTTWRYPYCAHALLCDQFYSSTLCVL